MRVVVDLTLGCVFPKLGGWYLPWAVDGVVRSTRKNQEKTPHLDVIQSWVVTFRWVLTAYHVTAIRQGLGIHGWLRQ